jgi:hypothetical protein
MKTIVKIAVLSLALFAMLMADVPGMQLVPEAQAILGVWRRHARRWAVVGTAVR